MSEPFQQVILAPPKNYEEWAERLRHAAANYRDSMWDIGDLLNIGEQKYGEMYVQAASETGLSFHRLGMIRRICATFPLEKRRALPFRTYEAVVSLKADEAEAMLAMAVAEEWNSDQVRDAVKKLKPPPRPKPKKSPKTPTPPDSQGEPPTAEGGDASGEGSSASSPEPDDPPAGVSNDDDPFFIPDSGLRADTLQSERAAELIHRLAELSTLVEPAVVNEHCEDPSTLFVDINRLFDWFGEILSEPDPRQESQDGETSEQVR